MKLKYQLNIFLKLEIIIKLSFLKLKLFKNVNILNIKINIHFIFLSPNIILQLILC